MSNIVLATDSYKLTHWKQYPPGTEAVYSYFEARKGATYPSTLFFGLQYILKSKLEGAVVTMRDVDDAFELAAFHFGSNDIFNLAGWRHVVQDHGGKLPLSIKAVPEGTVVPVDNVLMTVENTCPKCFWLTNFVESLLTHVWYPSTVATLSHNVKRTIKSYLDRTSDNPDAINFMLHDFGYRGATTDEASAIGGAGHLVNFLGTDTLPAMQLLLDYYGANLADLAFSVPATEHSVMTAQGKAGEYNVLARLLGEYPSGILSVVADSYDIYAFTDEVVRRKAAVLARDGRFVLRPDSVTAEHETPAKLVVELVRRLANGFGTTTNRKGYGVLHDKVRVLWGDGIDPQGIAEILTHLEVAGYAAENLVFGMGGGLLQKVNRDTQRFAFKSSAQKRNGEWHDVQKNPLDASKKSKAGRLKLVRTTLSQTGYATVGDDQPGEDVLVEVFRNGVVLVDQKLQDIRSNAS